MEISRVAHKLNAFLSDIQPEDRVALVFDSDSDGISAAVIIAKVLKNFYKRDIALAISANHAELLGNEIFNELKDAKITVLISTDLGLDKYIQQLDEITPFAKITIIDHHTFHKQIFSERILVLKPQLIKSRLDPSQYCTSKWVYDLFSCFTDISYLDWLSAVGLIADSGYRSWKSYIDKILRKYRLKIKKDPFKTSLGKICDDIAYSEIYRRDNVNKIFFKLFKTKSLKDYLRSPIKSPKEPLKEITYYEKNAPMFAENYGDLMILHITPKYRIGAVLSTRLSTKKYRRKTLIIVQDLRHYPLLLISARRNDFKIAVNELLERATMGMQHASAGGHVPASGARIKKEDYGLFKQRLIKLAKKR